MQELRVVVPARLLAALDDYARSRGVSRAEAVRDALCCGPLVGTLMRMSEAGISLSDVVGP